MVNATRGKHLGDVGVDTQLSKVDSETMGAQFLILMPCPVFRSDEKWTWTGVWASFVLGLPHLQFLIACSIQKYCKVIKNWRREALVWAEVVMVIETIQDDL